MSLRESSRRFELVMNGSAEPFARFVAGFHKGLGETGYVDGHNVTITLNRTP
jgi:hypothetical protein